MSIPQHAACLTIHYSRGGEQPSRWCGGGGGKVPSRTNERRSEATNIGKHWQQTSGDDEDDDKQGSDRDFIPIMHRDDVTASSGMYSSLSVCLSRPQPQLQPHKFYGPTSSCLLFKKAATAGFYSFDSMILHNDDWGSKLWNWTWFMSAEELRQFWASEWSEILRGRIKRIEDIQIKLGGGGGYSSLSLEHAQIQFSIVAVSKSKK